MLDFDHWKNEQQSSALVIKRDRTTNKNNNNFHRQIGMATVWPDRLIRQ